MKQFSRTFALCLLVAVSAGAGAARAQDLFAPPAAPPNPLAGIVTAAATPSHTAVVAGQTFHLAVEVKLAEGWHYYSVNPGENVMPASMGISSGPLAAGDVLWPADHEFVLDTAGLRLVNRVYSGTAVIFVPLTAPADGQPGRHEITLTPTGQICKDVCIPLGDDLAVSTVVEIGLESVPNPNWGYDDQLAAAAAARDEVSPPRAPTPSGGSDASLTALGGLGLALLAGLLLNVMPCVLPVVPMRILSLAQLGGQSRRRFVTLGLSFAGGILAFFVILASANIVIRTVLGRSFSWSEHYQIPAVRVALALVVGALAANLFGLYTVTVPKRLAAKSSSSPQGGGHVTAGGWGFMMALLATPCSFAILTGAMTWAQIQPLWLGTAAMLALGVGMAAPHAMLCAFPRLLDRLPRPGRWMELMRHSMGFLLLLLMVYLISTLNAGSTYAFWVAGFAVVLVFGLWAWGSWVRYDSPLKHKLLVRGCAALLTVGAGIFMLSPPRQSVVEFQPFTAAAVAEARRTGRPVLIKFTASWCVSCHVLDYTVYNKPEVAKALDDESVLTLRADVTDRNSEAARYLKSQYGLPVPLTVVHFPDGRGEIRLEGEFSVDELLGVLQD
jgi:thiol:disulfide interchange protein